MILHFLQFNSVVPFLNSNEKEKIIIFMQFSFWSILSAITCIYLSQLMCFFSRVCNFFFFLSWYSVNIRDCQGKKKLLIWLPYGLLKAASLFRCLTIQTTEQIYFIIFFKAKFTFKALMLSAALTNEFFLQKTKITLIKIFHSSYFWFRTKIKSWLFIIPQYHNGI